MTQIVRTLAELRLCVNAWKADGETVGVVPTMGALHNGHLSLVVQAVQKADRTIVTLFVNPKQFNNPDDLANYPRTEEGDAAKIDPLGADVLYVPDADQIYGSGFCTNISVAGISDGLCGANRPGHFDGVATVVTKLLLQSQADFAFFGEKDFQQLMLVQRLVKDLDIPTQIVGCPTIRDVDGLAMSSRNANLTPENRKIAAKLNAQMQRAAQKIAEGEDVAIVLKNTISALTTDGFDPVDYVELRSASTLAPMASLTEPARLLAAAFLGDVRLIDNIAVPIPGEDVTSAR